VLHLAPQPLAASDVYQAVTGDPMPDTGARLHVEDMRTAHAGLWGKTGNYCADRADVIAGIKAFFGRVGKA